VTVAGGPLLENVASGGDIDILKIPTPKWHEHDGGRYIGTGCMVIMQHPDTGWINYGAYRIQAQDKAIASIMYIEGQARQPDPAALARAWKAVPDRGRLRHASRAVHVGGDRDPLRQERVRCRRTGCSASPSR